MKQFDQDRFLELVRDLFVQPHEPVPNNDLPLSEPIDFNWAGPGGASLRLRLYLDETSVLAVKEEAPTSVGPWHHQQRVLIHGGEAVRISRDIGAIIGQ